MTSAIFVALPMTALTGAIMFLLPSFSPRRYFFAITVPPDFPSGAFGRLVVREYHGRVLCAIAIAIAVVLPLGQKTPEWTIAAASVLPILFGLGAFWWARRQVRDYSVSSAAVREAEISTEPERLPRWILLALPPFAAPVAAAAWLRAHWDEIPQRFPVHFDPTGTPDRWVEKTARAVYGPLLVEAGLMLFILLLSLAIFYGARRGPQRIAVLKMIVATMYFLAYVFTVVSLMAVVHVPMAIHIVPTALFTIAILVWSIKLARDPRMPVDRTPDEYWKAGVIYYNPDDPALFVQKRIGYGYTSNFGNPMSWVGIGIVVLFVIAIGLLLR